MGDKASLAALREQARGCQRCDLFRTGTQTVFGEGPATATIMIVGEQPGDHEDREGHPFVGPAGRLLDQALEAAGIDRERVYVTNTVKHFKWVARGKRRIHQKPNAAEIRACLPWLEGELEAVAPRVVVLLGATAAQAVMGPRFLVTKQRGVLMPSPLGVPVLATIHPSSILRAPDGADREAQLAGLVADLRVVAES